MKRIFWACALWILASCGVVQDELYRSGGYLGGQADSFLEALTPEQRFDRYMIVALILTPTALETAIDEEEAASIINRVNALYRSLTALRLAISCENPSDEGEGFFVVCGALQGEAAAQNDVNWQENESSGLRANGYAFETLENRVQQDLFFIARAVVTNLDLEVQVESLVNFNPLTLVNLWRKVDELLPMFRQTAARFRSGVVLYADIAQQSCTPAPLSDCQRLRNLMETRFTGRGNAQIPEQDIRAMLNLARSSFDGGAWEMKEPQYAAIIWQIDQACWVAYDRQDVPDNDEVASDSPRAVTCANGAKNDGQGSNARLALIEALGGPAVVVPDNAQGQPNLDTVETDQVDKPNEARPGEGG